MSNVNQVQLEAVEALLSDALTLADASLVIFRRGVLVEFKTGLLAPGLMRTSEGRYRSWQIGPFEGHHCHLDLASIERVWFDAEPVSCQGGRLNYTIWFLAGGDCGNPYRPDALFSVTLNKPYAADGTARADLIGRVFELCDRHAAHPAVSSSAAFNLARLRLEADTQA